MRFEWIPINADGTVWLCAEQFAVCATGAKPLPGWRRGFNDKTKSMREVALEFETTIRLLYGL